ncbi:hypothetical protein BT93_K1443 [Corymbia citriodora subsp. variegata]|nr:hypothetical protein BT93_K1443 [Corymbia citriodora subsp. variegata]
MLPQPTSRSLIRTLKPNTQFLPRRIRTKASYTSSPFFRSLDTHSLAHHAISTAPVDSPPKNPNKNETRKRKKASFAPFLNRTRQWVCEISPGIFSDRSP